MNYLQKYSEVICSLPLIDPKQIVKKYCYFHRLLFLQIRLFPCALKMPLDIEALKEPRGFIRCLELFFGIVAFSTLASFSTEFSFDIKCKNASLDDPGILKVQVDYPFNIAASKPIDLSKRKPCGVPFDDVTEKYSKITFLESFNFSSDAQFYVFVGVVSFLYAGLR